MKLNGTAVFQSSWAGQYVGHRGVNVVIVDLSNCTMHEWRNFDTYGDQTSGVRLRDYLQGLSIGTVLVVLSADSPGRQLSGAFPTLSAFGADVSDVGYRGGFAYAGIKGDPSKTVFDKRLTQQDAYDRQPYINVTYGRCDLLCQLSSHVYRCVHYAQSL